MSPVEAERTRRLQAAVRKYSSAVRWMKIALPIAAVALIGLVFLSGQNRSAVVDFDGLSDLAVLEVGLKLDNPRFAGLTDDGDPFIVTADWALPDGAMPDLVDLARPRGELRFNNGRVLNVRSREGQMFPKDEQLHLIGDVVAQSSDGYQAATESIRLDLAKKSAVAPGTVRAEGPRGDLVADRMQVERAAPDSRDLIVRFEGNVRVRYRPATGPSGTTSP